MRTVIRQRALLLAVACAGCSLTIDPESVRPPQTQPAIALSPATLGFTAPLGGANPDARTVQVTNSGGGVLAQPSTSVAYQDGNGWLTATIAGSSAPYQLSVQPTIAGLVPATYVATVRVASLGASNSPQPVIVSLTISPPSVTAGGCITSATKKVCAGELSAGGAERLSSASYSLRRSSLQAGGAAVIQSGSHRIAHGALSPGANPP